MDCPRCSFRLLEARRHEELDSDEDSRLRLGLTTMTHDAGDLPRALKAQIELAVRGETVN